jgi:hypothetical protein
MDINMSITKIISEMLFPNISDFTKMFFSKSIEVICESIILRENIKHHKKVTEQWSNKINIKDMASTKKIDNVFIHLDLYLYPKSIRILKEEIIDKIKFIKFLSYIDHNAIILG